MAPAGEESAPLTLPEPLSQMYAKAPETLLAVFRWRL